MANVKERTVRSYDSLDRPNLRIKKNIVRYLKSEMRKAGAGDADQEWMVENQNEEVG